MKIPFGLLDKRMVAVSEVVSGKACGCLCPECNTPLVAKKGPIKTHHFAHESKQNCLGGLETSIHLMAKQLIEEAGEIELPQLEVSSTDDFNRLEPESEVVTHRKRQKLTSIRLEPGLKNDESLKGFRPDIVGYHNNRRLVIEVYVTHRVGKDKLKLLRDGKHAAIEIDLSDADFHITKSDLRNIVIEGVGKKKWLSLPSAVEAKARVERKLNEKLKNLPKRKAKKLAKRSVIERPPKFSPVKKEENTKKERTHHWLLCEACRHYWAESASVVALAERDSLPCPECNHPVSLSDVMTKFRN